MENSSNLTGQPKALPISVVIPAFNAERYLALAMESVKSQTVSVAEIIVVNDGSTDRTAQIANDLGARVIYQENMGLAAARNVGIRSAESSWIALLDADDLWMPTKIERQWHGVELCPEAVIVTCDHSKIDATGAIRKESCILEDDSLYRHVPRSSPADGISVIEKVDNSFWDVGNFLSPSTILFKKELGINVGLFNEELKYLEDVEFFLRLLAVGMLLVIEAPLMQYRIHESNWSKNDLGMSLGFLKTAELLRSNPEKYPKDSYRVWSRDLPEKIRYVGILHLKENRPAEARSFFRQYLGITFSVKTALLLALSYFPKPFISLGLTLKRLFA